MNRHLAAMKTIIDGFWGVAKSNEEKKERVRAQFREDIAAEQVKQLENDTQTRAQLAKDAINEELHEALAEVERWGELDGAKINDNDMKLLKLDLSPEQFAQIVERNRNNGTMCFILKQYAEKHARAEKKDDEIPMWNNLASVEVPTVDEKIKAYNIFAENAIGIIQNITGYGWGRGVDGFGVESSVKGFGEPNQINYKLLEVLGG